MTPREVMQEFSARQRAMYLGGDAGPVEAMLAEEVVWHVPGTSPIAGDHRGRGAVLEYFLRRRDLAGGTMEIVQHAQICHGDTVIQLADGRAAIGEWRTAGVYRVAGGQIEEAWLVPLDLEAFERVWGAD